MAFYLCTSTSRSVSLGVASFYTAVYVVFFVLAFVVALRHCMYEFWIAPLVTALVLLNASYLAAVEPGDLTPAEAQFTLALLVFDAFTIPLYILQLFELTFMVHRNRSVNFCCVQLEEVGSRRASQRLLCVRLLARGLILALAVLALASQSLKVSGLNADLVVAENVTLCSRGVFATYLYPELDNEYFSRGNAKQTLEVVVDLLQPLVLLLSAAYLGLLLWRYGTFYAFRPSSLYLNPWVALSVFSLAFLIAMFFYTSFSAFTLALLILQIACFLITKLVIDELHAFHDLNDYLEKSQRRMEPTPGARGSEDSDRAAQGFAETLARHATSSRVANGDDAEVDKLEDGEAHALEDKARAGFARNAIAPHEMRVSRRAEGRKELLHSHSLPLHLSGSANRGVAQPLYPNDVSAEADDGHDLAEVSIHIPRHQGRDHDMNANVQPPLSVAQSLKGGIDSKEHNADGSGRPMTMSFDLGAENAGKARSRSQISEATICEDDVDDEDDDDDDSKNNNNHNINNNNHGEHGDEENTSGSLGEHGHCRRSKTGGICASTVASQPLSPLSSSSSCEQGAEDEVNKSADGKEESQSTAFVLT
ncbi:Hypothetical Protein FCC1311_040342 [Hondaea fermentalgiana]|uniref:Transmembrane protein n=1 Tax=Hondaea fermentalgiana TaxID=2315210 RepID=A0A2R5GHP7_9STRA|nr:Hypothetical Protein FCC1311_040342 [Hondaea fermentalgiana]|eukprot:GBG27811.1 Hypothetical Protein FCC1311_040342 [Hondaea fermentalgiana]